MTAHLKRLLTLITEIGTSDIYTDAPEYAGRVAAMRTACLALELHLMQEPVTAAGIREIERKRAMDITE